MMEFKMPVREQNSNKGTFGKVLNFAGSKNYIGAAYLSTAAVLKIGAGFAALSSDKTIIRPVSALLPEAVYLSRNDGIKNINDFSVVMIGCGLGGEKKIFERVIKELQNSETPVVIDADGLNILSGMNIKLPVNTVLTPHPLEAARLLGVDMIEVLSDLPKSTGRLCEKYGCVAVLKTHETTVRFRDNIYVNHHGNSALAKAGSGDVLAGIIAGLLAQKMTPFEAAKLGVYLHSISGEIASADLTEYSVCASDLIKYLPKAIKNVNTEKIS